jgi:hypothetical protein
MSTRIALIITAALAGSALAGPVGLPSASGTNQAGAGLDPVGVTLQNLGGMLGGGGTTDDPLFPAIHPSSHQSLSLRVLGAGNAQGFANSLGDVVVKVNTGFQNLGTNSAGNQILGQVRQYYTPDDRDWVEVEFKTANGAPLVPVNMTIAGQSVIAFGWEVGRTDPIDWHPWWTSVEIPAGGVTATFFGPGGNISHNHTPELVGAGGGAWNGVDTDNSLIPLGDLFSRVLIKYQVNPVPAPAALGVLGLGLGLAGRRRR